MQIFLTRHGQSRWQIEREREDWDSPLTPLGQDQVRHLAAWLADTREVELSSIRSSSLIRAQQTATPIAQLLQIPLVGDDNFQESDFLVSDALPSMSHPEITRPFFSPSQPYCELKARARRALQALIEDASQSGGAVLGVAHGGLISTMLRVIIDNDSISFWIYNATLHLLEWKRGRWHIVFLNRWDHLPASIRTY